MKKAIITGITGQDGAYLAQILLEKGYKVFATYRRTSSVNFWRIEELGIEKHPNLHLVEFDLTDLASSIRLIEQCEADEVYNLAAQSFVGVSFDQPIATAQITGIGPLNLLEAIRIVNPKFASTRPPHPKCLARCRRYRRRKTRHSIREVHMALQNSMVTGSRLTTEKVMIFLQAAVSCSTTKVRYAVANS